MKSQITGYQWFRWACNLIRKSGIPCTKRQFLNHVDLRGRRHLGSLTSQDFEEGETEEMADRAEIQGQIKAQGEVVRQLKAEKADKAKVLTESG